MPGPTSVRVSTKAEAAAIASRVQVLEDKTARIVQLLTRPTLVNEGSLDEMAKEFRFGPVALSATYTTNLLNPPTTTGGVGAGSPTTFIVLRHIRILNKTGGAQTFRLFVGATGANAAGTEFMGYDTTVPGNSAVDWVGRVRLDSTDFLVGGASAGASLTIEGDGEIGVA